jgi:hypothetical protein
VVTTGFRNSKSKLYYKILYLEKKEPMRWFLKIQTDRKKKGESRWVRGRGEMEGKGGRRGERGIRHSIEAIEGRGNVEEEGG